MDSFLTFLNDAPSYISQGLTVATAVVTGASAVSAVTRTPKDDAIASRLLQIIDFFALNIGHARRTRAERRAARRAERQAQQNAN